MNHFQTLFGVCHILGSASLVCVTQTLNHVISYHVVCKSDEYQNEQNHGQNAVDDSKPSKHISASLKTAAAQKSVQTLVLFVHFAFMTSKGVQLSESSKQH